MTTAFVSLTDASYYDRALCTLTDLRERGGWTGDVVLICVDFDPAPIERNVIIHKVDHIDHTPLWETWKDFPIPAAQDGRHYKKVYQWDKLQVFSEYFRQWDRVIFLDAGLRVLDSVEPLLELEWKKKFLAPDDSDPYDNGNRFQCQVHLDANPKVKEKFLKQFDMLNDRYFLNCIFVFDTNLGNMDTMKSWMYEFPVMACNEMGIMNMFFKDHWSAFPQRVGSKYLFGWCELNYTEKPKWDQFHFLKYPVTMAK